MVQWDRYNHTPASLAHGASLAQLDLKQELLLWTVFIKKERGQKRLTSYLTSYSCSNTCFSISEWMSYWTTFRDRYCDIEFAHVIMPNTLNLEVIYNHNLNCPKIWKLSYFTIFFSLASHKFIDKAILHVLCDNNF